ncbi:response regulator transcription factor [Enterocloster lavalensis]|uniref:response regulator transcription factor n=1 Tax=Enterocloster lavalensis TaxID=460384 RepID=UPI0026671644|nr:response regulator [Enterocloster lavalensis]
MYKVIIVEDEDIIRKGLVYSVPWAEMDCNVVGEAANGIEGLELIREQNPDIAVIDINMPVMDGFQMLENSYEQYNYAPIILSGYSDFEYAKRAIHYGVKGYLLKPLNMADMKEAVRLAKRECEIRGAWISHQKTKEDWESTSVLKDFQKQPVEDRLARRMLEYIFENYQQKIVMQDLVDHLNYSEAFLNRKFKDAVGTTFNDYLNRYRIQKALEMIREGELPIQDIAWKSGIGDYKYFRVVFRKYLGCSPKEYMKEISS